MPINVMDATYDSFTTRVLPELTKRHVGVLGMKPLALGCSSRAPPLGQLGAGPPPPRCLQYAMSLPTSVVITGAATRWGS